MRVFGIQNLIFIVIAALVTTACAQTPLLQVAPHESRHAPIMLWEVASENRPGKAYLLGSVHLGKSSDDVSDVAVREAFEQSVALMVEVDEARYDPTEIQELTMMKAAYRRGDSLVNHVSKDTFALFTQVFRKLGLPAQHFTRFKPWFLSLTASVLMMNRMGYSPDNGVDKQFLARARRIHKPVGELESPEYQLDVLGSLSPEHDEANLRHTLENIDQVPVEIDKIREAYIAGNVTAMTAIVLPPEESNVGVRQYMENVMYARNRTMAQSVDRLLMDPGPFFIVVGVGHLVGERSLLNHLAQKGYGVQRVSPKGIPSAIAEPQDIP